MKNTVKILLIVLYMAAEFVKIPSFSLSPDKITLFERIEWTGFTDKQYQSFENLKDNENKYNELSDNARKRLLNAVNYMLYLSKNKHISGNKKISKEISDNEIIIEKGKRYKKTVDYNLTFITLTLSGKQRHSDKEITRRLLGSFLDELRRKWKAEQYIWKAEKQENGNIHYHIITNKFIHWKEIRTVWNRIQNKKGFEYVDEYSAKMQKFFEKGFKMLPGDKRSREKQYEAYSENKKNNWTNPNSTDIHALYKVKNIAAYITKYVSKPVTKTSRVKRINQILNELEKNEMRIKKLEYLNTKIGEISNPGYAENLDKIFNIKKNNENLNKELEELKSRGVEGRIWGQSRNLSKLKAYTDVESFYNIPEIDKVEKIKRHKTEFDVGFSSSIVTYYFDMNKTPALKQMLDTHLSKMLNGYSVIDKLERDYLEREFYSEKSNFIPPGVTPDVDNMVQTKFHF